MLYVNSKNPGCVVWRQVILSLRLICCSHKSRWNQGHRHGGYYGHNSWQLVLSVCNFR